MSKDETTEVTPVGADGGVGEPTVDGATPDFATLVREAMAALDLQVSKWHGVVSAASERWQHIEIHATGMLEGAVKRRGLIIPVSQLSFSDVVELFNIYESEGNEAVARRLLAHYDELFGQVDFLRTMELCWADSASLRRRMPLLREALMAHGLGMFAVSIPTLLAQFEGLVVDVQGHTGTASIAKIKSLVEAMVKDSGVLGEILHLFTKDTFFAFFEHGSNTSPFSRHAILHGGDVNYANEINSRTAIFLIDFVRDLADTRV